MSESLADPVVSYHVKKGNFIELTVYWRSGSSWLFFWRKSFFFLFHNYNERDDARILFHSLRGPEYSWVHVRVIIKNDPALMNPATFLRAAELPCLITGELKRGNKIPESMLSANGLR